MCLKVLRIVCHHMIALKIELENLLTKNSGGRRLLFLEVFLKSLSLFHCVLLYVCRLCINFQDMCARLLGVAALRILLLTFISYFVIDF